MLRGLVSTAKIRDLREANKLMRFAKATKQVTVKFPRLRNQAVTWADLGFLSLSDAAWATRPDGSLQGGYVILLVPKKAFNDQEIEYSMLDWRSFKLPRVSRSSLNAEAQSAADTADALEYAKVFWNLLHHLAHHGPECDGDRC